MRVVLTGATGFLGRPLVVHLASLGYECIVLTRDVARAAAVEFPASVKILPFDPLPPAEVVIHLAGESVAGYWTPGKRRAILESRVDGTRRLVAALRQAKTRPHTLLAASAVGIYGHRPGEALEETAAPDPRNRFRAQVCGAWEEAANGAEVLGIRVVNLRLGNLFDPDGGYLGGLLPIYRHLGGWIFGEPTASIPWIARSDAIRLIDFALANERWYGPLNVVAPESATHLQLASALGERFGHGGVRKIPAWLTRAVLGEFASALVDDQRVVPGKALSAGFPFRYPALPGWLEETFPRKSCRSPSQGEIQSPGRLEGELDLDRSEVGRGALLEEVGLVVERDGGSVAEPRTDAGAKV